MSSFETAAVVLVLTAIFALINRRLIKLPEPIGVMILALGFSMGLIALGGTAPELLTQTCHAVAEFDFSGFLLEIALGFLIFAGAFSTDTRLLVKRRAPVLVLATLGILLSTMIVGGLTWQMLRILSFEIPFLHCLLFGALISPTDPIAVIAILRKVGVSSDMENDIAGESLLNDGVAVVVFLTLFEMAQGEGGGFHLTQVGTLLLREVGGGVVFGTILGFLGAKALGAARQPQLDILLTLAMVAGGYSVAGAWGLSAPLAMVAMGLVLSAKISGLGLGSGEREHMVIFWESLDGVFNAVLFVLLGIVIVGLTHTFQMTYLWAGLMAIPLVLLARVISLVLTVPLTPLRKNRPGATIALLTWGGLRGGISVALALSLAPEMSRELLVFLTYPIVVFSIIVQGLSIGALARKLNLTKTQSA